MGICTGVGSSFNIFDQYFDQYLATRFGNFSSKSSKTSSEILAQVLNTKDVVISIFSFHEL